MKVNQLKAILKKFRGKRLIDITLGLDMNPKKLWGFIFEDMSGVKYYPET